MNLQQDAAEYCVVMVTVSSEAEGKKIAIALLEDKLAACINIYPVDSFYTWDEKINCDREWQLTIKTRSTLLAQLIKKINNLHSYDVPEFFALPMLAGSTNYLDWIAANTKEN